MIQHEQTILVTEDPELVEAVDAAYAEAQARDKLTNILASGAVGASVEEPNSQEGEPDFQSNL